MNRKDVFNKIFCDFHIKIGIFLEANSIKLGRIGRMCQIDESTFKYKQKFHCGRISQLNRLDLEIVDINVKPEIFFVKSVKNKKFKTLVSIKNEVCKEGIEILSYEWSVYKKNIHKFPK